MENIAKQLINAISEKVYWQTRCDLAEKVIEECPDEHSTSEMSEATKNWEEFKKVEIYKID